MSESPKDKRQRRGVREKIAILKGTHTPKQWRDLISKHLVCPACHRDFDDGGGLTRDHIQPICEGGSNALNNLQPLCRDCNSYKGRKTIDFINESGNDGVIWGFGVRRAASQRANPATKQRRKHRGKTKPSDR